jgi:hypothetical protein
MYQRAPEAGHSVEGASRNVHSNKFRGKPQCHGLDLLLGGRQSVICAGIYIVFCTDLGDFSIHRRSDTACTVGGYSYVPKSFFRCPTSQIVNSSRLKSDPVSQILNVIFAHLQN